MSAEQRKPSPPKESKRHREIPFHLQLRSLILGGEYEEWNFSLALPEPLIPWQGELALVYLGEIFHGEDLALNLAVIQQIKIEEGHPRINWYYVGYPGFPLKRLLREGRYEDYKDEMKGQKVRKIGKAKLYNAISDDVKRFRGY